MAEPDRLIHPTALVAPDTRIEPGVEIGSYTVIHSGVRIGSGTRIGCHTVIGDAEGRACAIGPDCSIGHHCVLGGPLDMAAACRISDFAAIGGEGQFPGWTGPEGRISIGAGTVIREACRILRPTETGLTAIGPHGYLMAGSHVDHDCRLGAHVKFATNVVLGGFVTVEDWAYLGLGATVHQRMAIGAGAMVGMGCAVVKNVWPYSTLVGQRFTRLNRIGLIRRNVPAHILEAMDAYYGSLDRDHPADGPDPAITTFIEQGLHTKSYWPDF